MIQREWQDRIRDRLRQVAPGVFAIVLVVASGFLLPFPHFSLVFPLFPVMAIYYWCLYWPALFPQWLVFLTGLLQDLLTGLPLGISALVFLLFRWLVMSQRRTLVKEPFAVIWGGFTVAAALQGIMIWIVLSLYYAALMPWQEGAVQVAMTALLYPCFHLVFVYLYLSLRRAS